MLNLDLKSVLSIIDEYFTMSEMVVSLHALLKGVTLPTIDAGSISAAVAIVGDVYSLVMKADDLADERKLCNKARMQIDVIEQKENKWDQLGHHYGVLMDTIMSKEHRLLIVCHTQTLFPFFINLTSKCSFQMPFLIKNKMYSN